MEQTEFSSQLVRSCADLVILTLLKGRSMHGYEILISMGDIGDGQFRFKQGTLYPLLYRLEREGWIESEWHIPDKGKKRKMYSLTSEGKRAQEYRVKRWEQFTTSINTILKDADDD